jgi:hypothetical protein
MVFGVTTSSPLSALETVAMETLASRATSRIVTRSFMKSLQIKTFLFSVNKKRILFNL